jgi:hypothetical protein
LLSSLEGGYFGIARIYSNGIGTLFVAHIGYVVAFILCLVVNELIAVLLRQKIQLTWELLIRKVNATAVLIVIRHLN